jgi:hypothetical protein
MARPLSTTDTSAAGEQTDRRLARSAARAFAAALSVLLVSTLVIDHSSSAIGRSTTEVGNSFEAGTIELTDDDAGRSLFDLTDMAPGRPAVRCIDVIYRGSILPVDLGLAADAGGELAPYLHVVIERGSGGTFESCEDFRLSAQVFGGTLDELADATASRPVSVATVLSSNERVSFRFRFELIDDEQVVGKQASSTFVWDAVPS